MMNTRINNTIRNTFFGLILKVITLIGAFASRSMLIYILGVEYVGLDGLFSSILTMLNMAELGFGSAVVYKLYQPLADNDTPRVCALLNFYRKIYCCIGMAVFILGIGLIPFLKYFVKGSVPNDLNLLVLYLIYLLNTCCSYWFFAYKTVLINAMNRNDIVSKVSSIAYIIKYCAQFILLLFVRSYYVYAIIVPITTLIVNIGNAVITNRYYPQFVCEGNISKIDKDEIKTKVTALIYNKLGVTIISASDNIVISSYLGLTILGIYDSYYYIFTMLYYFFSVFHTAVTAGVGNSIITENVESNYSLFKRMSFINSWLVGWCSICLVCLYEPFMSIWIGSERVLGSYFALLMSIYFYFWLIRFITTIFKNAQGLWSEDRYRAMIEGICNLLLNLMMVRIIGIYGITLSTIIAMLVISLPWETSVLFKKYFHKTTQEYYFSMAKWIIVTLIAGGLSYGVGILFNTNNALLFILRLGVCIVIPNTFFYLVYRKSQEFEYALNIAKRILLKARRYNG